MRFRFVPLSLLLLVQYTVAQDTVRVMTYNLLQYYPSSKYSRDQYFRTVVQATDPDILVVQEIDTAEAVQNFLLNVLNVDVPNKYSAGVLIDGSFDSENAIFYKTGEFEFIENKPIKTQLRDINQFTIKEMNGRTLLIFSVHLKAGRNPASQTQEADSVRRAMEVDSLRKVTNTLPAGTDFIVLGDFNIYHSFEPAYQKLLAIDVGIEGHFVDPLEMPGVWNDSSYAQYHTQATRGGIAGGLDDRFDMILMSTAVNATGGITFLPASYHAFGNDGKHYNDSINRLPNTAVSDGVANALHAASDHLPVIAEFVFDPLVAVEKKSATLQFALLQNYPNPFNPETAISYQLSGISVVRLSVFDILGREIAVLVDEHQGPGIHTVSWNASEFPTGMYFYRLEAGGFVETRKMMLVK